MQLLLRKKRILLVLLSFFLCFFISINKGLAQNVDSLKRVVNRSQGRERVKTLNNLAEIYLLDNASESLQLSKDALSNAKTIDDSNLIAQSYLNIGYALRYKSNYQEALDSLYNTISFLKKLPSHLQTQILNLIGMLHQDLGHDTLSIQSFIKMIESNTDTNYINKNIRILSKLANYYEQSENYKKALSYIVKLAVFQNLANDTTGMIHTLNVISEYYSLLGKQKEALEYANIAASRISNWQDHDSLKAITHRTLGLALLNSGMREQAIETFKLSSSHAQKEDIESILLKNSLELGKIYASKSDHDNALVYYKKALDLARKIKQTRKIAEIQQLSATSLLERHNFQRAYQALKEAKNKTEKDNFQLLANINSAFSKLYEMQGDLERSLHHQRIFNAYRDSLFIKSKNEALAKIKSEYEIDKKEQRIELLKMDSRINALELSKKKARITVLIVGIAALIIVVILVIILYRNKLKTNKLLAIQNHQIKEQNEELNIINERLLETEKRLKSSNNTKDKFFSIIAHDVKNPLNSFRSIIYTLKHSNSQNPENIHSYLNELDYYAYTTLELLNNLLLWAKSQEEDIEPRYEKFNLSEVIEKIINEQFNSIKKKNINVQTPIEYNLVVYSDQNMMEFILRNLLSNAIKFTPQNGTITFENYYDNHSIILKIKDSGIGIDEENLEKIKKNEYLSTPGTEKEKGAGLGLSMCQYFLKKINGNMQIFSKKGEGTKIKINFPKKGDDESTNKNHNR